jgi:hypothetical protein
MCDGAIDRSVHAGGEGDRHQQGQPTSGNLHARRR